MSNTIIEYSFDELLPLVLQVVKSKRTPFIWGPPGIGKSSLARKVAEELNAPLYVLDAVLLQPTDYAVPVPNHNEKTVELYSTGFLPQKGPAVVLIDDLPHAKTFQMIPLLQIVLDRRIGNMYFSDDVDFIVTGNCEEHLAYTNSIPSPFLNRVAHFDMKPDLEGWVVWAKRKYLDERIVQFVNAHPQYFFQLPTEGVRAWPTPRSWHIAADIIQGVADNQVYPYVLSTVGAVANVFSAWLKYLRTIDVDEIIEKGEFPYNLNRDKIFTIVQAVASKIDKKHINKLQNNLRSLFSSIPSEYKIVFLKELVRYKNDKKDISILQSFVDKVPESVEYVESLI